MIDDAEMNQKREKYSFLYDDKKLNKVGISL